MYIEEFDHNSAQVNFLVSLLLHYWQIGTAVYDPNRGQVKMIFFSKISIHNEFANFKNKILNHLAAHRNLVGSKFNQDFDIGLVEEFGITRIIVTRSLDLFFSKEITIIIELLTEFLNSNLLVDSDWMMNMDWVSLTDIDQLILDIKNDPNDHKLTGIRSNDRVAIYAGNR